MIGPTSVVVVDAIVTWNVELQWMCALDYASDRRLPLDLVAFAAPCLWRQRMIDALVAANREHRIAFTSQSVMALRATVENGLGIGLLPPESPRTSATRTLKPAASVPGPLVVHTDSTLMTSVRPLSMPRLRYCGKAYRHHRRHRSSRFEYGGVHYMPPLATITSPIIQFASSDTRKTATFAMSSGYPPPATGVCVMRWFTNCSPNSPIARLILGRNE